MKGLPAEDQKELVRLLVREISVKHFDPKTDQEPKEKAVFNTKIRTKWYLVNLSLFVNDLIPNGYKTGEISSDFSRIGSAGAGKNRTCWDLTLTIGIPFSRWGAAPFVLQPISFPHGAQLAVQANEKPVAVYASVHPFQLALRWQREIMADPQTTKARIAAREGLSRARVTQIMNLLQLPELIRRQLQDPPLNIHASCLQRAPPACHYCQKR